MLGFFKGVFEVFGSLARLIPNFPKFVLCFIKLTVISLLHMLLLLPGVSHLTAFLMNLVPYLIMVTIRVVLPVLMFVLIGVLFVIDMFAEQVSGQGGGGNSIGARCRRFIMLFNTCLNDPRAWFSQRRWHRGNGYQRLLGVYPCVSPCFQGYEPLRSSGGLLCKRISLKSPEFCTAAAVTRVVEGMRYRPLPGFAVGSQECREREAGRTTANQRALVRVACQQPGQFGNDFLRAPCFERYCAMPGDDETSPGTCASLVPLKDRRAGVPRQLLGGPVLVAAGCAFLYAAVTSLRAKQDEYKMLGDRLAMSQVRIEA